MTITTEVDWSLFTDSEIESLVDKGLRHESGKTPRDYLKQWLSIARHFAFTTHDDSFGEFEKEFAIIIKRLVSAERKLKELGVDG